MADPSNPASAGGRQPDADNEKTGHVTQNPGSGVADPSHSVPPKGGQPGHGSWSGNLGQRKSKAGPGSAAGQGAGGPGDSQSPQQVTRQPGSDGDPRGRSSDTRQTETESRGTNDAGGPGGNQSSEQNTGEPANGEGALNATGKLSSSAIPGKPVVCFKSGQKNMSTDDSPLTRMQWEHLLNEKQELDKLCMTSDAKWNGDGNIITFTSEHPQGDFLLWANNIIEKLKKLSSMICKTELVIGCQQLKAFEYLWNEEQGTKKNLVTCFYEDKSPKSKVTIITADEEVLKVAEDKANAILCRLREISIEVPLPYFDDRCLQHFIQPDKFPSITVWHEKKDVKLHEIKLCGLQSECDKALREITPILRALKMEEVDRIEVRAWISRTANHESLRTFVMKNQHGVLPIFGEKGLFLMGAMDEVDKAQFLLKDCLCRKRYSLSTEIWQPLMQSVKTEDFGMNGYFIQDYHLLATHNPSKEQLTLVGFLEDHQQLLQNVTIYLQKAPPGVLDGLQDKSAMVHVSTKMKGDDREVEEPVENVQEAYQLIKEVQKKAQQRAPEEKPEEISKDRLVTLLLMKAVENEVKAYLSLPGRALADVTWTIDGSSRHLQVNCKDKKRRDEAEKEIKSLFVEKENIVKDLDEAAAERLQNTWPDLVKELHAYDECCIASFDPDKKWVLLTTLKDRFDQTSQMLTTLMQRYQKGLAVKTVKLRRAQYMFLKKENNDQVTAVQSKVEGNGGTFDIQPGDDYDCLQIIMTGPTTVVSAAVDKLCQLQNDIHLVEAPDAAVSCLASTEEGRKFVSPLEEKYKCYIDLSMSDYAEVVLPGGTTVSLQHGPYETEGVDLVALPVPVEMENKTKSMKVPEECSKILSDLKTRFPRECERLREGKETVLLVTPPRALPCPKTALMAVPCKWCRGEKGEKKIVRSAVRELMEMTMREECSSVAIEIPSYLPENAAEKTILFDLREFFEKETGKAASPTGIKTVKLFTRRETDSTDPSQLLKNAFPRCSNSAQRKIVVAAADMAQAQEAVNELSKVVTSAHGESESSLNAEGTGKKMQSYPGKDVSARFLYFKKKVCASEKSIFVEAEGIMKKLVGCSISTNKGKLYLHCPPEKEERALALCQQFDELVRTAESGVSSLASSTTSKSEYDEALVSAARKFFPEMLQGVKETKAKNGKVVLTPALSPKDQNRISDLQLFEIPVKDDETEKAKTIYSAFLKDADIYVEYLPSKKVVAAVVRKYDLLQKVTSRIKVHLGQMKTAVRGKREFTTQPGKSDLDDEGASATAEIEAADEAVEEVTERGQTITLPGGLVVVLCVTDITKLKVDAIVNAANGRLAHGGGVARAIADAAGPDFIQECRDYIDLNGPIPVSKLCLTGAGRLPCNRVIHAVGPRWGDDTPEISRKQLYATVLNCCKEADEWDLNEIAMPPISSGIYGMPKDQCTEMYCKALLDFDQQPNKKLKTVHFVDINDDMPLALLKALRKKIGQGQQRTRPSEADVDTSQGCVICTEKDLDQPVKLNGCNHMFCKGCIEKWFQTKPTCPSCNKVCGIITGTMPPGTMDVYHDRYLHLAGFENCGRIVIDYSFLDGVQKAEHPNPGQRYRGTRRTAYLPDNAEGNKVLRLLQEAWDRKLTFTIGRSTTTGRDNVVTWNDIHHKTSTEPGHPFGYPDPEYLTRVQEELAARGVTEESIRLAQSGNPQDFSQFYTPLRPRRSTPM